MKALLGAACCTAWSLPASLAQDFILQNGVKALSIGAANGQVPVSTLPSSAAPNFYNGATPQFSQNIQYDGSGDLLFFIVDGRIYDKDGYLIADNYDDNSGREQLFRGTTQVGITAVPGSCGLRYYIIAAEQLGDEHNTEFGYSILDMSLSNPHVPQGDPPRLGRVLTDQDPELQNLFPNTLAHLATFSSGFNESPAMIDLDDPNHGSNYEEAGVQMAIYDPPTGSNERKLLFVVDEKWVHEYWIKNDGIEKLWDIDKDQHMTNATNCEFGQDIDRPYAGSITCGKNANGDLLVAWTRSNLDDDFSAYPNTAYTVNLCKVLTGGNYEFQFIQKLATLPAAPTAVVNIPCLAFSPNASHLYFTQSVQPYLGVFDLGTYQYTDLGAQFNIGSASALGIGNLYMDKAPNGNSPALYVIAPTASGYLLNLDDMNTLSWSGTIPASSPIGNAPTSYWSSEQQSFTAGLPDVHNWDEQQIAAWNANLLQGACCATLSDLQSTPVHSVSGTQPSWTATSNPFNNQAVVYFSQDFIVQAGANINVSGMTWRFGPNARLIVEPGAWLKFSNGLLTSYSCTAARWPGIRVEGTTSEQTQSNAAQGRLRLSNTEVSNAVIGTWCVKESAPNVPDPAGYGGMVNTYGSTRYRNCLTGVRIENYHRFVNGAENDNRSTFNATSFFTDATRPDNATLQPQAALSNTNGVKFSYCQFRNDDPGAFAFTLRGIGISANDARFTCLGNNYDNHCFKGLYVGISAFNIDPLDAYKVDHVGFENNVFGEVDLAGRGPTITNNRYRPLQSNTPISQTSVGLYLWGTELYVVERNTFENPVQQHNVPCAGIWFLGPTYQDNQIYDNSFDGMDLGNAVQGRHAALTSQGNQLPGLQLLCGDYQVNSADQFIYNTAYLRDNQGDGAAPANNRFFGHSTCSGSFEPYTFPRQAPYDNLHVNYHYFWHDVNNDPLNEDLLPECVEDDFGNSLTVTGDYYDLDRQLKLEAFVKASDCGQGVLDFTGNGGHAMVHAAYHNKAAEFTSAVANYEGTVDQDQKTDILTAINAVPAWPSYQLRDLLLGRYPLSDSVMIAAIHRSTPMDPWHLTQVLVANSKLSYAVWKELDYSGVLPAYFMDLLHQYDDASNLRLVLEEEIRQRHEELTDLQRRLVFTWAADTVELGRTDSLMTVFSEDADGAGLRLEYASLIGQGHFAAANALQAAVQGQREGSALAEVGAVLCAIGSNLCQATPAQRQALHALAYLPLGDANPLAWGSLMAIHAMDSVPPLEIPRMPRSAWIPIRRGHAVLVDQPVLQAYPDPATDRVQITYPKGLEEGRLEVFDAQGAQVRSVPLAGTPAFKEVDVANLRPGLYLVRLVLDGMQLGETKFTVAR